MFASDWEQIPEELIERYSPEVSHSMEVSVRKVVDIVNVNAGDYEWRKFEPFESSLSEDVATIFCGGPITAMAWLPTPHDRIVEQILAISIVTEFDRKWYIHKNNSDPELIQFWNFGPAENGSALAAEPQLEFCLCHDLGYVTHLEWCPSGCYDTSASDRLQRLGLLAVASSDSFVHIFAIARPSELGFVRIRVVFVMS